MHNFRANRQIEIARDEIRSTLTAFASAVEDTLQKTERKTRDVSEHLKEQYAQQEIANIRKKTRESVDSARNTAKINILGSFDTIEATVDEWVAQPVSPAILTFAGMIQNNGMRIGQEELNAMSIHTAGSYFGLRLLSEIARQNGLMYEHFDSLPVILRKIRGAKADCLSCVDAFCGQIGDDDKIAGTWLLDEYGFKIPWAAVFITNLEDASRNSFESIISQLLTMSDAGITLLPSESQRMAKLFEGKTGEDAIDAMIELQKNKSLREKLRLYDADLYDSALMKQRDAAYQLKEKAEKAAMESVSALMSAKNTAAKAEADIAANASKKL